MTPLAKLLEAALFAAPRPLTTEALASLDPESSPLYDATGTFTLTLKTVALN